MQRHSLSGIVAICGLMAGVTTARAGLETWVSGSGSDAGTCPITAPCRTFTFAHGQTTANGAINVLSSGNFGPVTITKAISIVAQGAEAVINTAAGGAGITVQVPATAIVSLRGLTIDMRGTANIGVSFVSGAALHVHNSVIRKSTSGIKFTPASGTRELYVAGSVITDSGNGIDVQPAGSAGATVMLDRVRVENGGMFFSRSGTNGPITATVRESVAAGHNNGVGIFVLDGGSGETAVMIDRSVAVNNNIGVAAVGAGARIRIGNSTVSGNGTGLLTDSGGLIGSYETNEVNGNGTDGTPTSIITLK